MKAKISVVIPAFNAGQTISQTIEALERQTYPRELFEIIVVDDGSTDNTAEIIRQYNVKCIYQEKSGPAKARNTGWRQARSEFIYFTDADCIPQSTWIAELADDYSTDKIGAVGGSYGIANSRSLVADCIYQEIIERHNKMEKYVRALGSYNLSVRRNVLEEVGGFNEEYKMASAEDNDLSYKILKKGYLLFFDNNAKVAHYHPQSLSRYLRTQFWHGFWRVKLYRDHPDMSKGDDYSSIFDYIQPVFSLLIIFSLPFIFIPIVRKIFIFIILLEIALQLPVAFSTTLKTGKIRYFTLAAITFLRGFARGLGLLWGILRLS